MKITRSVVLALLLTGCFAQQAEQTGSGDPEHIWQQNQDADEQKDVFIDEADLSEADQLALLYAEAITVRDTMDEVLPQMDPILAGAIEAAVEAFRADVGYLEYYTQLADREPLLPKDQGEVVALITRIEEAMLLFAEAIDLL